MDSSKNNVKVILRARPINEREIREDLGKTCITIHKDQNMVVMNNQHDSNFFTFDFIADGLDT